MACGACGSRKATKEEFAVYDSSGTRIGTKTTEIEAKAAAARARGTWKKL